MRNVENKKKHKAQCAAYGKCYMVQGFRYRLLGIANVE
ncbi:hypothetical protein D1BOALGB6SA_3323 [Olavius sp. associated proteobacterium Delta 1]|nr:hypothetical protein D1BOALGB6SA_3323 [Olavius sp. associated proteobacterium Delta 1]